jgi:hypothetical protein
VEHVAVLDDVGLVLGAQQAALLGLGLGTGGEPMHRAPGRVYSREHQKTDAGNAGTMHAPQKFAEWMSAYRHVDRRFGHVYLYHSRSDAHSIALCTFILEDLLATCATVSAQAEAGELVSGTNVRFTWPSGRSKTLDLAIGYAGEPHTKPLPAEAIRKAIPIDVLIACEAKTVMTEHGKSQPRVYDELSSSHEIVHQGRQDAIAAGITVINIADSFVSPLRQSANPPLVVTHHKQPTAASNMVHHLRGLPIRDAAGHVGFDAYATIVIDCDNQTDAKLWTAPPAPQPGDRDHYTDPPGICHN